MSPPQGGPCGPSCLQSAETCPGCGFSFTSRPLARQGGPDDARERNLAVGAAEAALRALASTPAGLARGRDMRLALRAARDHIATALAYAEASEQGRREG